MGSAERRAPEVGTRVRELGVPDRTGAVARVKDGKGVRVHFDEASGGGKAWLGRDAWSPLPVDVAPPAGAAGARAAREPLPRPRKRGRGADAGCSHCGSAAHVARACAFGADPAERFILCDRREPPLLPCFARHFLVLCRRAQPEFDVDALRNGRLDVACSSVSAALFRSQSLRKNVHVKCVLAGPSAARAAAAAARPGRGGGGGGEEADPGGDSRVDRAVSVFGALVRDLRPDDRSLAERLRLVAPASSREAAREAMYGSRAAGAEGGPVLPAWSASPYRGVEGSDCGFADALEGLLAGGPLVFLLAGGASTGGAEALGESIESLAPRVRADGDAAERLARRGLVCVLGDDRGLTPAHEALVRDVAARHGAPLHCVSLGPDVLFTSHCVVLLNHALDAHMHRCAVAAPRRLEGR